MGKVSEENKKLKPWEKKRLYLTLIIYVGFSVIYLLLTCGLLLKDNLIQPEKWESSVTENSDMIPEIRKIGEEEGAQKVLCGTYIENLSSISFKDNSFDGVMEVWFKWEGNPDLDMISHFRLYKGEISEKEIVTDYHEGNVNYQKARIRFTVSKNFRTPRFPLGSYQLHIYIEPDMRCDEVQLEADTENSSLNQNLEVSGYDVTRHAISLVPIRYEGTQSDPALEKKIAKGDLMTTEVMTAVEITRSGVGTYVKCFIALFATIIWVLITLYLCTVHEVDPLGMIPGAFFGAVSNIMVGASLLPDALQPGLIEYVNIWGIANILACTVMIISINSIRKRYHESEFARHYGRIMLITSTVLTVLGNILLPLVCVV